MDLLPPCLDALTTDEVYLLTILDECDFVRWRAPLPRTKRQRDDHAEPATPTRKAARADMADTPVRVTRATGCTCRRTRCLKLYCVCFAAGNACGTHCKCSQCDNVQPSSPAREPLFCSCRKQNCSMRYCVCRAAGRTCGPRCKCTGCQNCSAPLK